MRQSHYRRINLSHKPRKYQADIVSDVLRSIKTGNTSVLYTAATGTGKTNIAGYIFKGLLELGYKRILFIAHQREIITQALTRIPELCGLYEEDCGLEMAGDRANGHEKIVFASIQTVSRSGRLDHWKPDVIFIDEAHHAAASTYLKVIAEHCHKTGAILIGCTATPYRMDNKALVNKGLDGTIAFETDDNAAVFDVHAAHYDIEDAIQDGWLVEPVGVVVRSKVNLDDIKTNKGDFNERELSKKINEKRRNELAVKTYLERASTRRAVVFCCGIDHASEMADMFERAGVKSAYVYGDMDPTERENKIQAFRKGEISVLCNDKLVTEGIDIPAIDCIICLRPTKSWSFYVQCVGRGLRPHGVDLRDNDTDVERCYKIRKSIKPNCLVIDVVDVSKKHKLCSLPQQFALPVDFDLQGESAAAAKTLKKKHDDLNVLIDKGARNISDPIERIPTDYRSLQTVVEYAQLLKDYGQPAQGWRATPQGFVNRKYSGITGYLEGGSREGWHIRIETPTGLIKKRQTTGEIVSVETAARFASNLLEKVALEHRSTRVDHPHDTKTTSRATDKQVAWLTRNGVSQSKVETLTIAQASKMISDTIAGFRKPKGQFIAKI